MGKIGIDTSAHNGVITESILNQVDFVIARLGYGSDIASQDDPQFKNTVALCQKLNKPWGAYIYSYALNTADAVSEAAHTKRVLEGLNPPLGIWFDMEDADGYKKKNGCTDKETIVNICKTYCDETGAGIYASLSWLNGTLNDTRLDGYQKWVAQWSPRCTYQKPYEIWQNTNCLVIDSKRFDGNIMADAAQVSPAPAKKTVAQIAQEVMAGAWGNGADRKAKLEAAGYNYTEVQNEVNKLCGAQPAPAKKTVAQIAQEVMAGAWGNGADRKAKLEAAGYNYTEVQNEVNKLCGAQPAPAKKSNEEVAREVLRGQWGNGQDRKNRLAAAGYNYSEIQKIVNKL